LPRKLALAVTEANKHQIGRESRVAEAREAEEKQPTEALAQRITTTVIARCVRENDALCGSVTPADMAHALEAKGFHVDKRKIVLAEPLKAVGEVTVPLKDSSRCDRPAQGHGRFGLKNTDSPNALG
jgi:large subunit ribosomal protein L9